MRRVTYEHKSERSQEVYATLPCFQRVTDTRDFTTVLRPRILFVSRRIASRIYEISDPKNKALVLSLRAEYTRSRVQKKDSEHERT